MFKPLKYIKKKVVNFLLNFEGYIVIEVSNITLSFVCPQGPDDELFPAQEALLHIQTQIVDLVPDKDNIVTTRLLVSLSEIGCLEGRDGSLSEMKRLTGANIQILSREELPSCVSGPDEIVQVCYLDTLFL